MTERAKGLSSGVIFAMMALAAVAIVRALLPIEGPPDGDFVLFLQPWMDAIRERGLASIAGDFSEYTPPYIYLLNLAALIEPSVGTLYAIKLVNVPFVVSCACGIGAIVRQVSGNREYGVTATAVMLVCPSMMVNAFAIGQCDVIYGSFLIWFVYFAMRDRPTLACVMFGLAVSFKLQALFLAPLLGTLWLWRRIRIWQLLLIPATYVAMMVPASLAGRPWGELLTVYAGQTGVMHELSLNAPNPWWFLRHVLDYRTGVVVGLVAGIVVAGAIVWQSMKLTRDAFTILLVASVSAALMPWVLPKMTARYFFMADLLTIALAFSRLRLWPAAVLVQIASLLVLLAYFVDLGIASLAFGPMTLGVGILTFELFRRSARKPNESPA